MSRRAKWIWSIACIILFGAAAGVVAVIANNDDEAAKVVEHTESFTPPGEYAGPVWFEVVANDHTSSDIDVSIVWGPWMNEFEIGSGEPLIYWMSKSRNLGGDDNPPMVVTISVDTDLVFGYGNIPIEARAAPDDWVAAR